jgi:hypothetical protein
MNRNMSYALQKIRREGSKAKTSNPTFVRQLSCREKPECGPA